MVQTCSLNCSKEHKVKNDCDGKRDKTAFIPFAEFNESSLMSGKFFVLFYSFSPSDTFVVFDFMNCTQFLILDFFFSLDFRFIEEVGKSIDNASRENSNTFPANKLSQRQKILQKNANKRSMSLHFLPNMLSGHQTNQSSFDTKYTFFNFNQVFFFFFL